MLVLNKTERVITVGKHFKLLPGLNDIPEAAFAEGSKIDLVKIYLKEGTFKVIEQKGKPVDGAKSIADVPTEEAVELVKQTVDAELLKRWKVAEKRHDVIGAIEEQLDKVTPDAAKKA